MGGGRVLLEEIMPTDVDGWSMQKKQKIFYATMLALVIEETA